MLLSKEASNNDTQLKSHLLLSFTHNESKTSEKIWIDYGFFWFTKG